MSASENLSSYVNTWNFQVVVFPAQVTWHLETRLQESTSWHPDWLPEPADKGAWSSPSPATSHHLEASAPLSMDKNTLEPELEPPASNLVVSEIRSEDGSLDHESNLRGRNRYDLSSIDSDDEAEITNESEDEHIVEEGEQLQNRHQDFDEEGHFGRDGNRHNFLEPILDLRSVYPILQQSSQSKRPLSDRLMISSTNLNRRSASDIGTSSWWLCLFLMLCHPQIPRQRRCLYLLLRRNSSILHSYTGLCLLHLQLQLTGIEWRHVRVREFWMRLGTRIWWRRRQAERAEGSERRGARESQRWGQERREWQGCEPWRSCSPQQGR